MSALTPHIKVLRAEGAELMKLGQADNADAKRSLNAVSVTVELVSALVITRMAQAKLTAADALEAEEHEREGALRS